MDNHVVLVGAGLAPALLEHLTWNQIAATLRHPGNPVGQGILSAASMITAAICQLTGDRPASACPPGIRSLQVQP